MCGKLCSALYSTCSLGVFSRVDTSARFLAVFRSSLSEQPTISQKEDTDDKEDEDKKEAENLLIKELTFNSSWNLFHTNLHIF